MTQTFSVAIATMMREEEEILPLYQQLALSCHALFINQCQTEAVRSCSENINLICTQERGISISRNTAIDYCTSDIMMIGDDDVRYVDQLDQLVLRAYEQHPGYDVICFRLNQKQLLFGDKEKRVNRMNLVSLCSVQISFVKDAVVQKGIRFHPAFGSGSQMFISGEENIFLKDCIKAGLKVLYVPIHTVSLLDSESSWFHGYDKPFFQSKGALFVALFGWLNGLVGLLFLIMKYPLYHKEISFIQAVRELRTGRSLYQEKLKEQDN